MFDTKEGNALQELAANGASPNAFTSNAITGYYFESTEKFEENLRILLSFVSVPYFTKESVDKEQGIIGQEIGMIEDDPDWEVFMDLMQALYENHPVRVSAWRARWSPSPTSPPRPSTPATRPSTTRPIWCCAWRATWTRSGSARSAREILPETAWSTGCPGGLRRPGARERCASP